MAMQALVCILMNKSILNSCFQQLCSTYAIKHFLINLFLLAKAHLHSALKLHEEAMKARQICRHCRKIVGLQKVNAFSLQENAVFGISVRCQFTFYLTPASHMEVGCPGTWGLELQTPNPGSKSTPQPSPTHNPATSPRPPHPAPGPSTRHTEPGALWK